MISEFLGNNKSLITEYLDSFFSARKKELFFLGDGGQEVLQRLFDFTTRGKMIRGGCTILGYNLFCDGPIDTVLPAAAAAELFQSALLIHDDIMDRDESRRGFPSIHFQYHQDLKELSLPDTRHTGESLAMCGGDIAFFLGYELLSLLRPPETGRKIIEYASKELSNVAVAQMTDVRRGIDPGIPEIEDIIDLYRYKTGRYTFSLPLWMGARLGGTEEKNLVLLEKIGELMGIIFQIKDDELGLFGDEKILGKPIGSDIREGKKTLHLALMHQLSSESERQELVSINQIKKIQHIAERLEIRKYIDTRYIQPLTAELELLLDELSHPYPPAVSVLNNLNNYITSRKN